MNNSVQGAMQRNWRRAPEEGGVVESTGDDACVPLAAFILSAYLQFK